MTSKKMLLSVALFFVLGGLVSAETITLSGTGQVEDLMLQTGTSPYMYFNEGGIDSLSVGIWNTGGGGNTHSLIRFLGLDAYAGETVASAKLKLYYTPQASQTQDTTLEIYTVSDANVDWVEGSTQWNWAAAGESCWQLKNFDTTGWAGSVGCSTEGTDYDSGMIGSQTIRTLDAGWIEISISASVVQDWIDNYSSGEKNPGLFLRDATDGTSGYQLYFSSSEGSNSPTLEVTFVPEPATILLLGSGAVIGMIGRRK